MVSEKKCDWKKSQALELQYHITSEWRRSGDFMPQTELLFSEFGFTQKQYEGKVILDLGAGSQLRTAFFQDAYIIALEPLAVEFIAKVDNSNLYLADAIINSSAEKFLPWLEHSIDFCISINVLDHCYDFKTVCQNIFSYVKPGGGAFFSFDFHDEADDLHPLSLSFDDCICIFKETGFAVAVSSKGFPDKFFKKYQVHSYGGGVALNFWLTKNTA